MYQKDYISEMSKNVEAVEVKVPKETIYLKTKENGTIVQYATNAKCYVKNYYKREYKEGEEYRTKTVTSPFNIDGKRFTNTKDLFDYLKKEKNYNVL